jgi:Spy/CpxP family protein refolding chaperone
MIRTVVMGAVALLMAAGPSFAQAQQGQRQGRGNRGGRGATSLLFIPEVQKELSLDQAQIDLLQGLRQQRGTGNGQDTQNLSPEERRQRYTQLRAEQDKKIAEILNAKQVKRLKELEIQQAGYRSLERKEVADQLKLSSAQQQQIQTIVEADREAMRAAFQGFRSQNGQRPSDADRQAAFQKFQEQRKATDAKLAAVLTDSQKKQFDQLKGAPFTFPQRQRRGGNNNA